MLGRPRGALVTFALASGTSLLFSAVITTPSWAVGSNGEATKAALTILADAKHATDSARTAHVVGAIHHYRSSLSFDITLGHGQGGGAVTADGSSFDIVLHRPKVYLKAPRATWTKQTNATVADLLANRWLETTTANKDFRDLANVVDIVKLTSQLTPSGKVVKHGTTSYRGQPAIALFDSGPSGGTLYVAAQGAPYILGVHGGTGSHGNLVFSQYNSARVPSAPKHPLNLDALAAAGGAGAGAAKSGASNGGLSTNGASSGVSLNSGA